MALLPAVAGAAGSPAAPEANPRKETFHFDPPTFYAKFFETVVDAMVAQEFKNDPNFGERHKAAVLAEVFRRKSAKAFGAEFAKIYADLLESVWKSGNIKGREEERAYGGSESIAMPIAMMIASEGIEVYRRKVMHPDFTAPFFANTNDPDEEAVISWIQEEVSREDADGVNFGQFKRLPNDRVFRFNSPPVTWNILTGRSGYAVIRENKLVHHVVTVQN